MPSLESGALWDPPDDSPIQRTNAGFFLQEILGWRDLGFLTGVSPASQLNETLKWETTAEEEAARKGVVRDYVATRITKDGRRVNPVNFIRETSR